MTTCQRWNGGRESRRPAGELIRPSEFEVAPITESRIAASFIETHHYSRTCSSTARRFGLYHRGELAGVALFGPPPSTNAHRAVFPTLTQKQAVTLGRLVLLDEVAGNGESWFVSRCFELLARKGVIAIESCSDPWPRVNDRGETVFRGHLGIVYQATNGRYIGRTNDSTLRLFPDGTVLSNRAVGKLNRAERGNDHPVAQLEAWGAQPLDPNEDARAWLKRWRSQLTRSMRHRGNHRYLWCLDRKFRREVLLSRPKLPYPKWD